MCEQDEDRRVSKRVGKGVDGSGTLWGDPGSGSRMAARFVCVDVQGGHTGGLGLSRAVRAGCLPVVLLAGIASSRAQGKAGRKTGNFSSRVPFICFLF